MTTKNNDFVEHVLEMMRGFGPVTAKAMFGGWGLYHQGTFFALIVADMLYLKADDGNRAEFAAANLPAFVYVTKDGDRIEMTYHQAPADALETAEEMLRWARSGYGAALRARAKKPARKRASEITKS